MILTWAFSYIHRTIFAVWTKKYEKNNKSLRKQETVNQSSRVKATLKTSYLRFFLSTKVSRRFFLSVQVFQILRFYVFLSGFKVVRDDFCLNQTQKSCSLPVHDKLWCPSNTQRSNWLTFCLSVNRRITFKITRCQTGH